LSNKETDRAVWLVVYHAALAQAATMRWSQLQPLVIAEGIDDLLALQEAASPQAAEDAAYCRKLREQPREVLDPPPLLTGDDLCARGVPPGPIYKVLLERVRAAQLDGEIHSPAEAWAMVSRATQEGNCG
jgi:poly(A) polymerase